MGKKGINLLSSVYIYNLKKYFNVFLTGFLSSVEDKAYKTWCSASSHLRPLYLQGQTDSQGSINFYFVIFGTTAPLDTAGLNSLQMYLNSTSQEKRGVLHMTFNMFSF